MQAIRYHQTGGPEVLKLEDAPDPTLGTGEVLIRVAAAGLNFFEVRQRSGNYRAAAELPMIPGGESSGVVVEQGPGLSAADSERLAVGTRVAALTGGGSYAQLVKARAATTYRVPDKIPLADAAAIPLQGLTAFGVLAFVGRQRPGDVVLVHAAAGGVGTYALQLARLLGAATVIGTAGSAEKLDYARSMGADVAINYQTEDFAARVREVTNNHGADVIADSVSGATFDRGVTCLARFGRIVVFGGASGQPANLTIGSLQANCQTVGGYNLNSSLLDPDFGEHGPRTLFDWISSGRVKVHVGHRFSLEQAAEAQQLMEERGSIGKILLVVDASLT